MRPAIASVYWYSIVALKTLIDDSLQASGQATVSTLLGEGFLNKPGRLPTRCPLATLGAPDRRHVSVHRLPALWRKP